LPNSLTITNDGIIIVEGWKMFTNPFDPIRRFGFFPTGVTDGMILKTPTVAELTVVISNRIVVDFEAQSAFVARAIKIEVLGK
jgi:hypothetical protein